MKKALIAASLSAALLLGGCGTTIGDWVANPKNDVQIARAAFSAALSLFHTVCDANAGASFCTLDSIQTAESLEQAVQRALDVVDDLFSADGKLTVTADVFQKDIGKVLSAEKKFSDFVNKLQADKTKALVAKMGAR